MLVLSFGVCTAVTGWWLSWKLDNWFKTKQNFYEVITKPKGNLILFENYTSFILRNVLNAQMKTFSKRKSTEGWVKTCILNCYKAPLKASVRVAGSHTHYFRFKPPFVNSIRVVPSWGCLLFLLNNIKHTNSHILIHIHVPLVLLIFPPHLALWHLKYCLLRILWWMVGLHFSKLIRAAADALTVSQPHQNGPRGRIAEGGEGRGRRGEDVGH